MLEKADTKYGINYEILEKIKDVKAITSKYDSKELKFCTPNVVVVFSNKGQEFKPFSRDR